MSEDHGAVRTYWFRVYAPYSAAHRHQVGYYIVDLGDVWGRGYRDVARAVVDDFGNLVRVE